MQPRFYGPDAPAEPTVTIPVPVPVPVVVKPLLPNDPIPGDHDPNLRPPARADGTYDQTALNWFLAEEKRRFQDKQRKTLTDLEKLQATANLTEQQKTQLQDQINQLRGELQTKEQKQQTELQKWETKYSTDVKARETERDQWKQRYEGTVIQHDIAAAASKHDAIRVAQVEALLLPLTQMKPVLDDKGQPTDNFAPIVMFTGRDKDNKPVQLSLSVEDAVKAMTEMPEEYGNLFRNKATAGVGGGTNGTPVGGGRIPNIDSMSPAEYRQHRDQIRQGLRKAQG